MFIQGADENTMIGVLCNALIQENVGVCNSNYLKVCNLWYAYVPTMMS